MLLSSGSFSGTLRASRRRVPIILASILLLLAGAPAVASEPAPRDAAVAVSAFESGAILGTLMRPHHARGSLRGIVLVLHDALGPDPRAARYAEQLLGAGIAVLEISHGAHDVDAIGHAAAALLSDPRLDGAPLGILGFGMGARIALRAGPAVAARALLYPGCAGLPAMAGSDASDPLLLLHGDADEAHAAPDCDAAARTLSRRGRPVRRVVYRGAGYAWDHPLFGQERRMLLPHPGGTGRLAVTPWPELAALSAAQVARFFAEALDAARPARGAAAHPSAGVPAGSRPRQAGDDAGQAGLRTDADLVEHRLQMRAARAQGDAGLVGGGAQ